MTKEEREHDHIKEIAENYVNESWGSYLDLDEVDLVMAGIGVGKIIASEQENRIAELEGKISVLLSCKNCSENKGGYICEKEYENKCLAQKIQFIKELQEEIAELKAEIENDRDLPTIAYMQGAEKQKKKDEEELKKWKDEWQEQVQKENDESYARTLQTIQLNKTKDLLKRCVCIINRLTPTTALLEKNERSLLKQIEQFINEVEK